MDCASPKYHAPLRRTRRPIHDFQANTEFRNTNPMAIPTFLQILHWSFALVFFKNKDSVSFIAFSMILLFLFLWQTLLPSQNLYST